MYMQTSDQKGSWLVGKAVYKCAGISQISWVVGWCVRMYTVRMYTDMQAFLR